MSLDQALEQLPDDDGLIEPEAFAGPDHPMRNVTRQVAFEDGWSSGRAKKIADLFDGLAEGWAETRGDPLRLAPVADGLRRGGFNLEGRWLELGSGTGAGTRILAEFVSDLVAADLSAEMLANAPADVAPRIRADASSLPFADAGFADAGFADAGFADAGFDGILMVNMLLFPDEVDRVLAPNGKLLWVNTLGDQTPIHLPAQDLVEAMPGDWSGVTARSGSGFWVSIARS